MKNIKIFTNTLFLITFLYSNLAQAMQPYTQLTIDSAQDDQQNGNLRITTARLNGYTVANTNSLDEILDNVYVQRHQPIGCCTTKPLIRRLLDSGVILFSGVSAASAGAAFKYDWLVWVTMGSAIIATCCKAASLCFSEELQKKLDYATSEIGIINQQINPVGAPLVAGAHLPAMDPTLPGRIQTLNNILNQ